MAPDVAADVARNAQLHRLRSREDRANYPSDPGEVSQVTRGADGVGQGCRLDARAGGARPSFRRHRPRMSTNQQMPLLENIQVTCPEAIIHRGVRGPKSAVTRD